MAVLEAAWFRDWCDSASVTAFVLPVWAVPASKWASPEICRTVVEAADPINTGMAPENGTR